METPDAEKIYLFGKCDSICLNKSCDWLQKVKMAASKMLYSKNLSWDIQIFTTWIETYLLVIFLEQHDPVMFWILTSNIFLNVIQISVLTDGYVLKRSTSWEHTLFVGILFTLTELDTGGGGVSGLWAISSSGARSGFSAKMLSRSICSGKSKGLRVIHILNSYTAALQLLPNKTHSKLYQCICIFISSALTVWLLSIRRGSDIKLLWNKSLPNPADQHYTSVHLREENVSRDEDKKKNCFKSSRWILTVTFTIQDIYFRRHLYVLQ